MSLPLPPNVNDLRGRVFGRLTVREFAGTRNGNAYWICDCSCGTTGKEVRGKNLLGWEKSGRAITCGCYRADSSVRQVARLTMPEEARRRAARGEKIAPERPAPVPRPKPKKKLLPFKSDKARDIVDLAAAPLEIERFSGDRPAIPIPQPAPPTPSPAPRAPSQTHSIWAAITEDRNGGYRVVIRLHRTANAHVMTSRRVSTPSDARREADRIFGRLLWKTTEEAGITGQPWVVAIAEVMWPAN